MVLLTIARKPNFDELEIIMWFSIVSSILLSVQVTKPSKTSSVAQKCCHGI